MSASNQQTLADLGANERPPMLEKWNYIPWENSSRRFLDNKLEEREQMWHLIEKGPYVRSMILDPDDTREQIIKPLSKMTEINKKQYIADVRVMNYLLQAVPNDIYNSVDACKTAQEMSKRIKRLMYDSDVTNYVTHSRLMDEFEKFAAKEGELLEYVYERLTTLVNIMDRDSLEDKLTAATMLLARAITQKLSIPTNNRLRTSSNTRNKAVIRDGRVDIQTKNVGYHGNGNRNARRQYRNKAFNVGNGLTKNDESYYACDCQKPRVHYAKYFRQQMSLAMKDEAESNLKDEENDVMLDNSYGDETLEELTAVINMMAQIQQADDNVVTGLNYDAKVVSE
nr:hypothetical protein [Tanacetum cinerariifolium]